MHYGIWQWAIVLSVAAFWLVALGFVLRKFGRR